MPVNPVLGTAALRANRRAAVRSNVTWLRVLLAFIAAQAVALAAPAQAEVVYRCGADGNVYGQAPCTEGLSVEVGDFRNRAQQAESLAVLERERDLGDRMAKDRRAEELAHPPARAGSFSAAASAPSAERAKRPQKSKPAKKPVKPKKRTARETASV
jgi:hypothetical protein